MMLTEFLKIIEEKSEYDRNNPWYVGSETYLEGIADEIKEVKAEMRDENQIFLTDELTDILWDYLNLLSSLKKEGKIESIEAVIQHAERKYGQRIAAVKESWLEGRLRVKDEQKKYLQILHKEKYER